MRIKTNWSYHTFWNGGPALQIRLIHKKLDYVRAVIRFPNSMFAFLDKWNRVKKRLRKHSKDNAKN